MTVFLDEIALELMASVRQIAIPVWVDIFQSTEDRNRTKGGGRENSVLFCLFEL